MMMDPTSPGELHNALPCPEDKKSHYSDHRSSPYPSTSDVYKEIVEDLDEPKKKMLEEPVIEVIESDAPATTTEPYCDPNLLARAREIEQELPQDKAKKQEQSSRSTEATSCKGSPKKPNDARANKERRKSRGESTRGTRASMKTGKHDREPERASPDSTNHPAEEEAATSSHGKDPVKADDKETRAIRGPRSSSKDPERKPSESVPQPAEGEDTTSSLPDAKDTRSTSKESGSSHKEPGRKSPDSITYPTENEAGREEPLVSDVKETRSRRGPKSCHREPERKSLDSPTKPTEGDHEQEKKKTEEINKASAEADVGMSIMDRLVKDTSAMRKELETAPPSLGQDEPTSTDRKETRSRRGSRSSNKHSYGHADGPWEGRKGKEASVRTSRSSLKASRSHKESRRKSHGDTTTTSGEDAAMSEEVEQTLSPAMETRDQLAKSRSCHGPVLSRSLSNDRVPKPELVDVGSGEDDGMHGKGEGSRTVRGNRNCHGTAIFPSNHTRSSNSVRLAQSLSMDSNSPLAKGGNVGGSEERTSVRVRRTSMRVERPHKEARRKSSLHSKEEGIDGKENDAVTRETSQSRPRRESSRQSRSSSAAIRVRAARRCAKAIERTKDTGESKNSPVINHGTTGNTETPPPSATRRPRMPRRPVRRVKSDSGDAEGERRPPRRTLSDIPDTRKSKVGGEESPENIDSLASGQRCRRKSGRRPSQLCRARASITSEDARKRRQSLSLRRTRTTQESSDDAVAREKSLLGQGVSPTDNARRSSRRHRSSLCRRQIGNLPDKLSADFDDYTESEEEEGTHPGSDDSSQAEPQLEEPEPSADTDEAEQPQKQTSAVSSLFGSLMMKVKK